MDSKDVEALMGGGDGTGGIFTWREKNRRKVGYFELPDLAFTLTHHSVGVFCLWDQLL